MNSSSQRNLNSPFGELLWAAVTNTGLASLLVLGTWAVAKGRFDSVIQVGATEAVALAVLTVALIGLLTYLAGRARPGWPESEMARAGEQTRMQVESEWREPIRLAQEMTSVMEQEVSRMGPGNVFQSPKKLVINRLHLSAIRSTKAALSLIQAGFPESALREWRPSSKPE